MKKIDGLVTRRPWRPEASCRERIGRMIERAPRGWRTLLRDFVRWLEQDRGLTLGSIDVWITSVREFVAAIGDGNVSGSDAFRRLTVQRVEDFFIAYCCDKGKSARRKMQATMRLVLQFAACRRWVQTDLAGAVPSLRTYRLAEVPRGLRDEDVAALLRSVSGEPTSARDRAIVFLLACYGVRRGHVCGLLLEDIDWRSRTITFRGHKGGKTIRQVLMAAPAAALASYIRNERPASRSPHVFLRGRAPHLAVGPAAVTAVVYQRLRRLGVSGVPRGPHALRHAFARRLLRGGQPLKSIADLLGHRSLDATSIYAKVDHPRLFEVAADWPEVR